LSARWRRNKRSSKFDAFKALERNQSKHLPRVVRVKSSWIKRQEDSPGHRTLRINFGRKTREPDPLVDVLDESDYIVIVADLVGYDKRNIIIHVKDQRLTLSAKSSDRKFYKSLNLPKRVIAATMHTNYKNGVLEIRLRKILQEKAIDEVAGQKNAT
jgi:HSP20 family molecular chaperone IbpA